MTEVSLSPAMPLGGPVEWAGAKWVGRLELADAERATGTVRLLDAEPFTRARMLVFDQGTVRGFVEVPVRDCGVEAEELRAAVRGLPPVVDRRNASGEVIETGGTPVAQRVTVAICTHDRPARLRFALKSVLEVDYDDFDVLVVDNAPSTSQTRDMVEHEFSDPRVHYVLEPIAGVQRARQTALEQAEGTIVAFVDDDVVVDPGWLRAIVNAFALGSDVVCVTGLVPSGEVRSPVQAYFDSRVSWAKNLRLREFRLSDPPKDLPMFPFSIGEFGTGANHSVIRSTVLAMGGYDERLGTGEDIDIFIRVLFAGHALVITPDAVAWHRHRSDVAALSAQARGYGTGLGAWLTKVAMTREMRLAMLRRAPVALFRLITKNRKQFDEVPDLDDATRAAIEEVGNLEIRTVLLGPGVFLRQRERGRLRSSLKARIRQERPGWSDLTVLAGLLGLLAAIPALPTAVRAVLTLAFIFFGPGAAIAALFRPARALALTLVPLTGVSVLLIVVTAQADLRGWWAPAATLIWGAVLTLVAGIVLRIRDVLETW